MRLTAAVAAAALAVPPLAAAQDTTRSPGVRVGITYAPGTRPAVTVVRTSPPAFLDSVRVIIERDLDHSDRFAMVARPSSSQPADLAAILASRSADLVVQVDTAGAAVRVTALEVTTGRRVHQDRLPIAGISRPEQRVAVHRVADAIVRATTGTPGIAATRIAFVRHQRLVMVDADGHGPTELRAAGAPALSPAFAPDGRTVAYTAFVPAGQPIVLQDLVTGAREVVPGTEDGLNITPEFSRDGRFLAFARGTESGTEVYLYELARRCCVRRLTARRFSDDLSPTWSPDGSRLAFISTRAGSPQLYVVTADGSGAELLGRFDFGHTGPTQAPAWSPDGQFIAFHREVGGVPQLFVLELSGRTVRQLTGAGRNEDPTWAPDGRHLAFASTRSGSRELWVVDVETGRVRQLTTSGGARLPAWSPSLTQLTERE